MPRLVRRRRHHPPPWPPRLGSPLPPLPSELVASLVSPLGCLSLEWVLWGSCLRLSPAMASRSRLDRGILAGKDQATGGISPEVPRCRASISGHTWPQRARARTSFSAAGPFRPDLLAASGSGPPAGALPATARFPSATSTSEAELGERDIRATALGTSGPFSRPRRTACGGSLSVGARPNLALDSARSGLDQTRTDFGRIGWISSEIGQTLNPKLGGRGRPNLDRFQPTIWTRSNLADRF